MMTVDEMIKEIRVQQVAGKVATTDSARADAAYEIGRLVKMLRHDHGMDDATIGKILGEGAK
jgi:hypothetical protein